MTGIVNKVYSVRQLPFPYFLNSIHHSHIPHYALYLTPPPPPPGQKKHKLCFSFMDFLFLRWGWVRGGGEGESKVCYGRLQVTNKGIQDSFTKRPAFCICFPLQQEILSGTS